MINYPLGLVDRLYAIGFYAWEEREYSQYLAWDRSWDRLTLNVSAFRYPDSGSPLFAGGAGSSLGGYGGQVVLIFNH
jgi:hypothetical protein